jgi:DNA-binding GntR family transcriptional regulator
MRAEHGKGAQVAYQRLRDLIIGGQLAPGSWLIEADLSDHLGLSRTPVRAALQTLQKEGYVRSSHSGARSRLTISPLTHEDAQELYLIVGRLEGLAARLTARLPNERRAAAVRSLSEFDRGLLKQARQKRSDPERIFALDLSFHRTVVEASAGPRLLELHRTVQPQAERYWRLYAGAIVNELNQSVEEHTAIVEAIEAGDSDAAELGIQRNWSNGAKRLAKVIRALGERGNW